MPGIKYGFWTAHGLRSAGEGFRSPPNELQLSVLRPGVPLIHGSDTVQVWMLREVFDTFDEGKAWMDGHFHEIGWDDYLADWERRKAARREHG